MVSALASAAMGGIDPFGLLSRQNVGLPQAAGNNGNNNGSGGSGGPGNGGNGGPPPPPPPPPPPGGNPPPAQPPAPPTQPQSQYDISSDPVLQQVNAMTALTDQHAQASALRDRQQQLLNYGDPALAASILGINDPFVGAVGQNQDSTLSLLGRARDQNLHNFTTTLDPSLAFSGYRIGQEGLLGQQYQDSLARAAAGIQGNLGGISDNLNATLEADANQRAQALADAYARAIQQALGA